MRLQLRGGNSHPLLCGIEKLSGTSNYFIGNDPKKWRRNVPQYAKVKATNVYPGIDMVYYGHDRHLEYDFMVHPGADPKRIQLQWQGVQETQVDDKGNLILKAQGGKVAFKAPAIYQVQKGKRKAIQGRYRLAQGNQLGFEMSGYDSSLPLVIDPILDYSTYLGGSGSENGNSIVVDSSGNAYIAGAVNSANFPTVAGSFQTYLSSSQNAFVTKLNPTGTGLVYSTYFGGSNVTAANGIAVDSSGNAYLTGSTTSSDFPTTSGAFQTTSPPGANAYALKLSPGGNSLVYSTYLGGNQDDAGFGIAVDASGNVYVTGQTASTNFPTTAGAPQTVFGGQTDAFVTKINPLGTGLIYSTYLGGYGIDTGYSICVDSTGNAYVTGSTGSGNFPTTPGAFRTAFTTFNDAFVAELNPAGTGLVYSTYLGGNGASYGQGIALDSSGNAYVTGYTSATNFPTTAGAFQTAMSGSNNAFVVKFNSTGTGLVYSTYLGGSRDDRGMGIAVDPAGNAYIAGWANSINFPTTADAYQTTFGGSVSLGTWDAFAVKLDSTGSALFYSTYLGGWKDDRGSAIAVDSSGNIYVTGFTVSTNFPTTSMAFQTAYNGGSQDVFVTKITFLYNNSAEAVASAMGCPVSTVLAVRALNLDSATSYLIMRILALCGGCQLSDIMNLRLTMGWDQIAAYYGIDWTTLLADLTARMATLAPEIITPNQIIRGAANDPTQFVISNPSASMPNTLVDYGPTTETCPLCQ